MTRMNALMKYPVVLQLAILFALCTRYSHGGDTCVATNTRPNILYFYVDDMGWGSIGPNAQAARKARNLPSVRTPNLDALAKQGVNFSRGYGCHVCSPARSSQQSGFHQGHTFADRNDPDNAKKAMRSDDVLIGDALSAAGYVTGYWGKWGYGGSESPKNPVIENIQTLPTSHGYQFVLAELHHVRAHTFFQPTLWSAPADAGSIGGLELVPNSMARYKQPSGYPEMPASQNHVLYPETAYCDDSYAFAALDFVRAQGQNYNESGQPFFGILAAQIPHAPFGELSTLPGWDSAYSSDPHFASLSDQSRQWAAMVMRIDAHIGNLLAALDDPNNDGDTSDSIANNTLVVFQSDNGGPSVDRVVDVTDLMPTFCELANAPVPLGVDGVSIAPTLTGRGYQRNRDFIIHEATNGQSIIRGSFKLVRATKPRSKEVKLELYDLAEDHAEANNLAEAHPELVKELETLLIGERVAEPAGFANTYHHWTGVDASSTTDPGNWSDYVYANAGVTYTTDNGAPQLSWIANVKNTSNQPNVAHADSDLRFLGLEVQGNEENDATQSLDLAPGIDLTSRNGIRLSSAGMITVAGGTVSTLRWIDICKRGAIAGHGSIQGDVFNSGSMMSAGPGFQIHGRYQQSADGEISVLMTNSKQPSVRIDGEATLDGKFAVAIDNNSTQASGESQVVLTASKIRGAFANPDSEVIASDGTSYSIGYTETSVTLTRK